MHHLKIFIFLTLLSVNVTAQEMWGISNSNYAGNMGINLNPSTIVAAPYKYELHYFSMDNFAQNSYIYLPAGANVIVRGLTGKLGSEKNFYDLYQGETQNGFGQNIINLPAFISNDGHKAWGAHISIRNQLGTVKVPSFLAKYIYEGYDYKPFVGEHFTAEPFSLAYMSWLELGGTYGKVLVEQRENFLKAAVTGNFLLGVDGLYMDVRKMDVTVLDQSTVVIHSLEATIAHALDQTGHASFSSITAIRGLGLSTTLGMTYIRNRNRGAFDCNNTNDDHKKYDYRFGASLIDFGFIRFSKQAQVMEVKSPTDQLWSRIDTIKFHSFQHLDEVLSNNANGSTYSSSVADKSFMMFLPSAMSFQFDYSLTPQWYANLTWVNRIKYSPAEIPRGNQVAASIRYEKRNWEANANFTLFEYYYPAVGLALRHSFFVIGTDRLLEWFSVSDVWAFDLYIGFKKTICGFNKKTKVFCPAYN
jgi:hypothetical protein